MTTEDEFKPRKSKAQQKREAEAAQALGKTLVGLPAADFNVLLDRLDLPEDLREALVACRAIKSHEAHRRQLQYIGKLMRGIETAPIEQKLAELKRGGQVATAQLHQLERWRERLLSEGDVALQDLLQLKPQADAAQLRQLIERAHRESAHKQPPRAARLLFRYLRELLTA
jgi:ribosome-associated protein